MAKVRIGSLPLPIKLCLSYIAVLGVGALPTYLYLNNAFGQRLTAHAISVSTEHLRLLVRDIADRSTADRLARLQQLAAAVWERITYVDASGRVRFDTTTPNEATFFADHTRRLEVRAALGNVSDAERPAFDARTAGIGVARRVSATTHVDTLYVAMQVPSSGEGVHVLRLAQPVNDIERLPGVALAFFRNAQAAAVTVAILLSLVSAFLFMRPLNRLTAIAETLASGDYTVDFEHLGGHDEVGRVSRALQRLGAELRRRLAAAEASYAMLVELVTTLNQPLALFSDDRRVVVVNHPAEVMLDAAGGQREAYLRELLDSEAYAAALAASQSTGVPSRLRVMLENGSEVKGWLRALRRAGGEPYGLFMGKKGSRVVSSLPRVAGVQALSLYGVVQTSALRAVPDLQSAPFAMLLEELPDVSIVEADGRVGIALSILLQDAIGMARSKGKPVVVSARDDTVRVIMTVRGYVSRATAAIASSLLAPLGGHVEGSKKRCRVELPRA